MSRMPRSDHAEEPPPGRPRRRGWRRLAVLAVVPLLALAVTSASAQGVWVTVPTIPTPRNALAAATAHCPEGLHGTCVYTVGGDLGPDRFEAYSPHTNVWATLPPLKTPRVSVASSTAPCPDGVRGDCVYAVGGTVGTTAVATAEAFSTETGTWLTLPPMPTARAGAAAATAPCADGLGLRGTCVYVFGGNDLINPVHNTVEAYSPATGTWATVADLQIPRVAHGGAAAPCPGALGLRGTCVYAMGGSNDTASALPSAEVYSPVLNGWMHLPDMPTGRDDWVAAATAPCPEGLRGQCVYVLGGLGTAGTLDTVEAYSTVANTWVTMPSMPTPHRELAAAHAPCPKNKKQDCVYAIAGRSDAGSTPAPTEALAIERARATHHPKPEPKPTATATPSAPKPAPSARPSARPSAPTDPFGEAAPDRMATPAPGPTTADAPSPVPAPAPAVTPGSSPSPTPTPVATPAPTPSPKPSLKPTPISTPVTTIGLRP
ncbi:kelch repeat-containing protein [Streptomyces sp. NPDC048255]|uniref:Kelch repeat-containing protein n=1 Tax=Streptomyces sp. NPDC048255 TaxID=3154713 RepID=UPI0033D38EBB